LIDYGEKSTKGDEMSKIGDFLAWMNAGGQVGMKYNNFRQKDIFENKLIDDLEEYNLLSNVTR
jgi:hypothetical protein